MAIGKNNEYSNRIRKTLVHARDVLGLHELNNLTKNNWKFIVSIPLEKITSKIK